VETGGQMIFTDLFAEGRQPLWTETIIRSDWLRPPACNVPTASQKKRDVGRDGIHIVMVWLYI